jgi:hypothetical protein
MPARTGSGHAGRGWHRPAPARKQTEVAMLIELPPPSFTDRAGRVWRLDRSDILEGDLAELSQLSLKAFKKWLRRDTKRLGWFVFLLCSDQMDEYQVGPEQFAELMGECLPRVVEGFLAAIARKYPVSPMGLRLSAALTSDSWTKFVAII